MSNRIVILLVLIGVAVAATIFTIARAGNPSFVIPPAKQTFEAKETKLQATAAAMPHARKPPASESITQRASCPEATPEATGVVPFDIGPFGDGRKLNSRANAMSKSRDIYWIWAGAPDDYPDQGMIRVMINLADPCASRKLGTPDPQAITDYLTPKGPLTITKLEGDIILYSIAGGGNGRFNFVTGKFVP